MFMSQIRGVVRACLLWSKKYQKRQSVHSPDVFKPLSVLQTP